MSLFSEISISDGHITELRSIAGELIVQFIDWEENKWCISFHNVLGYKNHGVELEDLDSVVILDSHVFIDELVKIKKEKSFSGNCFEFTSSWNGNILLSIVAESYSVNKVDI